MCIRDRAPVAGRVADGEEDRAILDARPLQRLRAPWMPVHGVVRVLEQVRARLSGEPVREHGGIVASPGHAGTPHLPELDPGGRRTVDAKHYQIETPLD